MQLPRPTMPPTATPPAPPPQEPPQEPQQTASDRLLRAQAAELEALRSRVADLPDPDVLADWRAKAQQFEALQADLPRWREQLQQEIGAERDTLRQQVEQQQQALTAQQQQQELQTQFLRAGGNPLHFAAWQELYGSKYVKQADDGSFVSTENGQTIPLGELLDRQRSDALFGVLFHPRYGAGAGANKMRDSRLTTAPNLNNLKTGQLFAEAFAKRQ
jgi:hypothetical protein